MAAEDTLPRFFKVFISHVSSDSMLIPVSYNDELPRTLPKTAILQGTGGCVWKVEMKRKRDEVYFEKGWNQFVTDNSLTDGDFLTFVYNGDNVFEVSIYGLGGCKEIRAVTEVVDLEEESVLSLSSNSESDMANTINKNKGKSQVVEVEDESEDEEDTKTETSSEHTVAKTITRSSNRGKKKEKVVESSNEESDSDYTEASDHLDAFNESSGSVARPIKKRERETTIKKIKDPEKYLVDPNNVFFETGVKNRPFELLVHAQVVRDYDLKFEKMVYYIDHHKDGKLQAKIIKWKDHRVCIKKWNRICKRNKLKKGDGILCELKRKQGVVYAVIIHIVREKDL